MPACGSTTFPKTSRCGNWLILERNLAMEDFPIWLKMLVWLIVGGTILYAIAMAIYSSMMG
jgi:hypothetical protein